MPVTVPTAEEGAMALDALQIQLDALAARVTALEDLVTTGTPPDIEEPPDPVDPPDPEPTPEPPDPPPSGTLQVVVQLAGKQLVYNEVDGRDIGTYADPDGRFSERCTRVTRTDTPLRIDIRRMEGRISVVFAQGFWSDTNHQNLPGYTATIQGDELAAPATYSVPSHAAYQRTRWCSAAWPLPMRKLEDLYQRKLLPRFDPNLTCGTDVYYGPYSYTPMGLAGLEPYMPQTGGRSDIGHVTGAQGWYICHEYNPPALPDVLAQGEAAGTYTWDFCDPDTNAVIDPIEHYPTATLYSSSVGAPFITYSTSSNFAGATISGPPGQVLSPNGSPPDWNFVLDSNNVQCRIPLDTTIPASGTIALNCEVLGSSVQTGAARVVYWTNQPVPGCSATLDAYMPGSGVTIDSAHQPACSYLPFLLTGDPYHLENLQRQVAFIVMENPSAPIRSYGVGQPRAAGWSARTLAQCAKVSPDNPPSWLLPRAVYTKAIEHWATEWFMPETCDNPANSRQVLNLVSANWGNFSNDGTGDNEVELFQEDICLGGLSWLALLHPDGSWPEIVRWHAQQTMARLDPDSGWSPGVPTTYCVKVTSEPGGEAFGSWAEAWAANMATFGAYSPDIPPANPGSIDYQSHMSSSMAIAHQAGVDNAEPLRRLIAANTAGLEAGGVTMEANRCVAGPK